MTQQIINNDEFSFLEAEFHDFISQLSFSTMDLRVENINLDEIFASLPSDGDDHEVVPITEGLYPSDFENVFLDFENDSQSNSNGVQPQEDASVGQNSDAIDTPTTKQANGNQDGVMYQMNPSLFGLITGEMVVKQQPTANKRLRYQCDGPRFLPDSRYNPLSTNLPDLQSITLQENQQLGIVITIISDTYKGKIVHANDIVYRVDGAIKIGHGCVFVPLDHDDIKSGEKKFPRLSIIYKKCDEFAFDLTSFDPLSMFGTTAKYNGRSSRNISIAAKGKQFKEDYSLLSYKFVFHLALKQENVVYISDTFCETDIIEEQKASTKRSASVSTENLSEENSTFDVQMARPLKKIKSDPSSIIGLPVIRVPSDFA